MKKGHVIVLGILALLGSGCVPPKPSQNTLPEQTGAVSSSQGKTVSEADFISNIMKSGAPWLQYKDDKTGVSFRYPTGFFTQAQKYGDQDSGMSYTIVMKPTMPADGVCDGLGDVDCDIAVWPKRYANFKAALQGSKYTYGEYETTPVAQQVRTINGMKFVVSVNQGVNGSCTVSFVRATSLSYASFIVNICDDPQLNAEKWFGNTVVEEERVKAQNILTGKSISDSTKTKIQAMEQVLATLKLK